MLAVAVSTAVIGGSLIVGDSVRASLRQMTLSRLGGISHILHSPRFVREQLADETVEVESGFVAEVTRSSGTAAAWQCGKENARWSVAAGIVGLDSRAASV